MAKKGSLFILAAAVKAVAVARAHQRKINEQDQKLKLAEAIESARIAQEHNKVVLQDATIDLQKARLEMLQLQIMKMREEMGLTTPDFIPQDYD